MGMLRFSNHGVEDGGSSKSKGLKLYLFKSRADKELIER